MDDIEKTEIQPLKSGIPKPTSRPTSRPVSRPTPSARVRALGKESLDDVDPNSVEEDGSDDEEDDEDDDEPVHIEGLLHKRHSSSSFPLHGQATKFEKPDLNSTFTIGSKCTMVPAYYSLSDCSIGDIEDNYFDQFDTLEEYRDHFYLQFPYPVKSKRAYDPSDFEHLAVSNELKELFQYITRYTPQTIELDQKLRPFIPEYIPAVGDIDAFIKVPRPDGEIDKLGLVALDEPCAKQSDPTVLDLQLRALTKETSNKAVVVKKLENADKRPKEIDAWINSIANLHQSKPPPTVHYARNMPDIESLMQEWPAEMEECCNQVGLPTADLDCTLEEYVDIVCGLLDIPVYKSRIQSLHVLFSLYMEFKNSQHFRSMATNEENSNNTDGEGKDSINFE